MAIGLIVAALWMALACILGPIVGAILKRRVSEDSAEAGDDD